MYQQGIILETRDSSYSPSNCIDYRSMHHTESSNTQNAELPWQQHMRRAIRSAEQLESYLGLGAGTFGPSGNATELFPLFVPLPFADRIEAGNLTDPLLLQVLPVEAESSSPDSYQTDPVSDLKHRIAPGVIHKYRGRALLITTGTCAVHCRYCFRREYPYGEEPRSMDTWKSAMEAIRDDDSLSEVILSGGDPLTLSDSRLAVLIELIEAIPHVDRLRIHTRLPIMIPSRVTAEFCKLIKDSRLSSVIVIHMNHVREWDADVEAAISCIKATGAPVLNQAVLLRGINDTADAQVELCESLINRGVLPYYLNQLDRVRGAAHFEVPIAEGKQIMTELRTRLPGYAVPRYVQDLGEDSKTLIV